MSAFPKYDRYKDSGVEWLGEIPAEWESDRVFSVFNERVERGNADLPILNISIKNGVREERPEGDREQRTIEDRTAYKRAAAGDIAYNTMRMWQGAVGNVPVDGLISPAYVVARPIKDVNTRYYSYLFRSEQFQVETNRHSYGIVSDRNRLYWLGFKNIVIPIPKKPEQDRIVTFLDRKTSEIDALIAKKQRQIELLDEQKAILINRAVTRGLNPNAKLKPSGIEWIGDIPAHWEVKKLRSLLRSSVKNGISPPITDSGRVPTLSIAAVKNGQVTFGENVKFTAIHKSDAASYLLREGDILALRGNGSRHLVATAGIVGSDAPEGCIYPDLLIRIRPTSLIAPHYLVIQLNGVLRDGINLTAKTSAGIWKVSGESLSAQKVLLPPLDEQKSILEYVDSVQRDTDVCKSGIARVIESLKTLRSTLIAHAVTGGIKV